MSGFDSFNFWGDNVSTKRFARQLNPGLYYVEYRGATNRWTGPYHYPNSKVVNWDAIFACGLPIKPSLTIVGAAND